MKTIRQAFGQNCAVIEETGDGVSCGRCWHFVGNNDQCPIHGDVHEVMERWRQLGIMTPDRAHRYKLECKYLGGKKCADKPEK